MDSYFTKIKAKAKADAFEKRLRHPKEAKEKALSRGHREKRLGAKSERNRYI